MQKITLLLSMIVLMSISSLTSNAQEVQAAKNSFAVGFNINQNQDDYGLGIDAVSPYFSDGKIAFKFGINFKWFQFQPNDTMDFEYNSYQTFQLGVRFRNWVVNERIFGYFEAGIFSILPNEAWSSGAMKIGGYGLFGIEYKLSPSMSIYNELGGAAAGAKADKLPHNPAYSSGFLAHVGLRVNF